MKNNCLIVLLTFFSLFSYAENNLLPEINFNTNTDSIVPKKDSITTDSTRRRKLVLQYDYRSNTNYKGSFDTLNKQPSYSASITYKSKKGLRLGIAHYLLINSDRTGTKDVNELDINLGYKFRLSKRTDLSFGYSHFFYSKNTASVKSAFNNVLVADLGHDFKWFYVDVIPEFDFGTSKDFFLSIDIYREIEFRRVIFRKADLVISPEVDVIFGTQQFRTKSKDTIKKFTLSSLVFSLPVDYYIGNFIISAGFNYVKSFTQTTQLKKSKTSKTPAVNSTSYTYFNFGLTYVIKL